MGINRWVITEKGMEKLTKELKQPKQSTARKKVREILKENLIGLDNRIQQKVIGLVLGNSFLLAAFFASLENGDYDYFRRAVAIGAIGLCFGFSLSLYGDIKAKKGSIESRPLTKLREVVDYFWAIIPLGFVVIWVFTFFP